MFLLRILVFIVIIAFAYPYVKKGSEFFFKRIPAEVTAPIKKITKQVKELKEMNKK